MALHQESRYFFSLSISTNELISAPNIITYLPNLLPFDNEELPPASNPIPYPEHLRLSNSIKLRAVN